MLPEIEVERVSLLHVDFVCVCVCIVVEQTLPVEALETLI